MTPSAIRKMAERIVDDIECCYIKHMVIEDIENFGLEVAREARECALMDAAEILSKADCEGKNASVGIARILALLPKKEEKI